MDLRQLRYFTQIVESGSLSKASRQLFIAQPALSQQLSKLEGEVGKPLLTRSSRGVAPTENGLALYHHARFMLRQLDQALSIARKESGAVQGMVSVGPARDHRFRARPAAGAPHPRALSEHPAQRGRGHERPPRADDAHGPARPRGAVQQRRRARRVGRRPARGRAVRHAAEAQRAGRAAAHQRHHRRGRGAAAHPAHQHARPAPAHRRRVRAAQPVGAASSPRSIRCRC